MVVTGGWLFKGVGVGLVVVVLVWFLLNIAANLVTLFGVFLGLVGVGGCCCAGGWWL